ncbi:MAG TPA: ATP-grasp fold amidoligase family protein, partial [Opitutus sp.]|nr:ATP-grasp fold amidoligase family protein [Opitutus sp.]
RLPRHVMFEEFLGETEVVPRDYKFYVLHQKVRFISVDEGRFRNHTRDLFQPDWTPITSRIGPHPRAMETPAAPTQLDRMVAVAEALAVDSDFLRVDLYVVRNEIYFGELTHTPGAGNLFFEDPALNIELGNYWRQPVRYR